MDETVSTRQPAEGMSLIIISVLVWSISTIVYRNWAGNVSPFIFMFVRYLIATILVGGIWLAKRGFKETIDKRTWLELFVLGIIGIAFHNLSLFLGLQYISASMATILLAFAPIITELLSIPVKKQKLSLRIIGGAVISLVGVVIIVGFNWNALNWEGLAWAFGSMLALAIYNVFIERIMSTTEVTPKTVTFSTISISMLVFLPLALLDEPWNEATVVLTRTDFWLAVLYLAVFGVMIGRTFYNLGVEKTGANVATILINFIPLFTIILEILIFNEIPSLWFFVGAIFVIFGAITITKADEEKRKDSNVLISR